MESMANRTRVEKPMDYSVGSKTAGKAHIAALNRSINRINNKILQEALPDAKWDGDKLILRSGV